LTIKIVTDSPADLPPDLIQELDIKVYHRMITENTPASTSQPPPADFAGVYQKLLKNADEIISIHTTSKLSGIYNSALQGKNMISDGNRITVLDSLSTSMGLGLLTLLAARLAKADENLPNILKELHKSISQTRLWGYFDTLKYVLQGGRLGKAKALLGSVLPIKAILTMRNGELHPTGAVRTRTKGIERLIDNFKKATNVQDAAVVYSTTLDDAKTLKQHIHAISNKIPVYLSLLGPALGVHGGPGTLVLALREEMANLNQEIKESEQLKKRTTVPSLRRPKLNFVCL
jgi:DegV family protein with EDD domain